MPNILAENFPNCDIGGTAATLFLHSKEAFKSAGGVPIIAGKFPDKNWQYKFDCTIVNRVLQVPAKAVEATTNSDNPTNLYVATLVDQFGDVQNFYVKKFALPPGNGGQITWNQIREFNELPQVVEELGLTTDNVPEGTENLYFTDERVQAVLDEDVQLKAEKGENGGYAPLDLTGKVPTQFLPPITINNVTTVANQAARLALNAVIGDAAKETDTGETYMLSVLPATNNANWIKISDISPDWGVITNKPNFGTASLLDAPATGNASSTQVVKGNDSRLIPPGGTAGQVVKKIDSTNFNTYWGDEAAGGGGATGEIPFEDDAGADDNIPLVGGSGGGGGSSPVTSVNGQIGEIVLDTDDIAETVTNKYFTDERAQDAVGSILTDTATIDFTYNDVANQITADVKDASIGDAKLGTGINANKIGGGAVSNTEFSYLDGVTSAIQTQLDAKQTSLGFTPENSANKNQNNGYAGLDSSGLIPSALLPSFVDDVLEYANFAALPGTGTTGKIYVTLDTNKTYRWSGSAYVEISASPGSTDSVTEGSVNLYFTVARVLAAVLTGLSTASSAVISATDTVLGALGKLQAQITAYKDAALTFTNKTISGSNNTFSNIPNSAVSGLGSLATLNAVGTSQIANDAVKPSKLAAYIHDNVSGTANIDASAGFTFGFTNNTSSLSLAIPTNCNESGQAITIVIYNQSGGSMSVTPVTTGTNCYKFSADITSIDNIPDSHLIFIVAKYDSYFSVWRIIGYTKGGAQ